jgi:hypothetical protein
MRELKFGTVVNDTYSGDLYQAGRGVYEVKYQ